jgi:hypothetical protein
METSKQTSGNLDIVALCTLCEGILAILEENQIAGLGHSLASGTQRAVLVTLTNTSQVFLRSVSLTLFVEADLRDDQMHSIK